MVVTMLPLHYLIQSDVGGSYGVRIRVVIFKLTCWLTKICGILGWIPEDDITSDQRALQGWAGCLGLPRELFDLVIPHVVRPMHSNVKELSNCSTVNDKEGTFTVTTLGIRPLKDLTKLRQDSSFRAIPDICFASSSPVRRELGITSRSWEIRVDVQITELLEEVGLSVCHNKGN